MNKNIYKLFCAGIVGFGLAACSPDDFNGADPNGLPSLSGENFSSSSTKTSTRFR